MAIIEDASQQLEDKRGLRRYKVLEVGEAATAYALVNATAPAVWNGLIKQNVSVTELGGDCWDGDVTYGVLERGATGDILWSFNIATQSVKVDRGLEHIATYPAGSDADPHKGAIGVRDDGNGRTIEGAQIMVPYFTWDEEHWFPVGLVPTYTFITKLENLAASTNEVAWRIWQPEELLIVGIESTGSKNSGADVGIKFRFASARTKTNQTIGDITGITKKGQHYLWIEYEEHEDGGISKVRPVRVHVERVYEKLDWDTELPLPSAWS